MIKCRFCSQLFVPVQPYSQVYCSKKCGERYWSSKKRIGKIKKEKVCIVCQKKFLGPKRQKYCCRNCNGKASSRKRRGMEIKNQESICEVCGARFVQRRINNTSYCNHKCKKLGVFRKYRGLSVNGPKRTSEWGSGYITTSGYKMITKNHPNAQKRGKNGKGQIMEHIWVMSEHLNRPLSDHETVHHKNGLRADNRIENLELWSKSHPPGQRVEDKIDWCKYFLELYGYKVMK